MKYFFIFLGGCGLLALGSAILFLCIGVPANPQEVTKVIEISA